MPSIYAEVQNRTSNEAVKHETSTSYSHWRQFAITLRSRNLYLLFPSKSMKHGELATQQIGQMRWWRGVTSFVSVLR